MWKSHAVFCPLCCCASSCCRLHKDTLTLEDGWWSCSDISHATLTSLIFTWIHTHTHTCAHTHWRGSHRAWQISFHFCFPRKQRTQERNTSTVTQLETLLIRKERGKNQGKSVLSSLDGNLTSEYFTKAGMKQWSWRQRSLWWLFFLLKSDTSRFSMQGVQAGSIQAPN